MPLVVTNIWLMTEVVKTFGKRPKWSDKADANIDRSQRILHMTAESGRL
jgi:uncharacterized membrane protein YGL010W